jgi:Holliday junction resolvase RusA-like endonuclease
MIEFRVYGKPEPGGSKRHVGGHRIIDANPRVADWRLKVEQVAGEAMNGCELLRGPLTASFVFTVTRPKSHYGAKGLRASAPRFPIVKPDALKLARAVEDALSGVVYADDAQIVIGTQRKEYGEQAGVHVHVWELANEIEEAA